MAPPRIETIGRYKVLGVLGKGAMGIVYKGVDPVIDREVAIKTIRLALSAEELAQYEARFAQEIKTVGKLTHPHIVPIYDVGRTEHFAYMALEFIDGRDLKAYMAGGKPLDVAATLDLVAQVADGLAFAHSRDIVHRDVKPSNVMVARTEDAMVAKIMDFGIARGPASMLKTQTGLILGSPRYMSPEHVTGKNIGPHSDIFSLGVLLYEMLTGLPPFDAESVTSIMYQTVNVPEQAPSTRNRAVAAELDALVARALAKKPEERFATMREFHRALREMLKALPAPGLLPLPAAPATQTSPGFPALEPADVARAAAAAAPVPVARASAAPRVRCSGARSCLRSPRTTGPSRCCPRRCWAPSPRSRSRSASRCCCARRLDAGGRRGLRAGNPGLGIRRSGRRAVAILLLLQAPHLGESAAAAKATRERSRARRSALRASPGSGRRPRSSRAGGRSPARCGSRRSAAARPGSTSRSSSRAPRWPRRTPGSAGSSAPCARSTRAASRRRRA